MWLTWFLLNQHWTMAAKRGGECHFSSSSMLSIYWSWHGSDFFDNFKLALSVTVAPGSLSTHRITLTSTLNTDFRAFTNDSRPDWYFEQMVRYTARVGFVGYTPKDVKREHWPFCSYLQLERTRLRCDDLPREPTCYYDICRRSTTFGQMWISWVVTSWIYSSFMVERTSRNGSTRLKLAENLLTKLVYYRFSAGMNFVSPKVIQKNWNLDCENVEIIQPFISHFRPKTKTRTWTP